VAGARRAPGGHRHQLAARLAGTGIEVRFAPTTEPAPPLDPAPGRRAIAAIDRFGWIVVASAHGAEALARATALPPTAKIAAIGPATARALADCGVAVRLVAAPAHGAGLAAELAIKVAPGERLLVVRPEGGTSPAADALRDRGLTIEEAPLYRTVPSPQAAGLARETMAGAFAGILFTAPSALTLWLDAAGRLRDPLVEALRALRRAALGATTEAGLAAAGLPAHATAAEPTGSAAGEAIERALGPIPW
jgi:uroporphyrinogen-III synthase